MIRTLGSLDATFGGGDNSLLKAIESEDQSENAGVDAEDMELPPTGSGAPDPAAGGNVGSGEAEASDDSDGEGEGTPTPDQVIAREDFDELDDEGMDEDPSNRPRMFSALVANLSGLHRLVKARIVSNIKHLRVNLEYITDIWMLDYRSNVRHACVSRQSRGESVSRYHGALPLCQASPGPSNGDARCDRPLDELFQYTCGRQTTPEGHYGQNRTRRGRYDNPLHDSTR